MTANPLYRAWTKAIRNPPGPPTYNPRWIVSRRGWFKIYPDRIECGNLVIPKEQVTDAVMYESRQWFIPVFILGISTAEETWQFGFNPWAKVAEHLPFPFRREQISLHYSMFGLALRLFLFGYVIYAIWERISRR